jgi:hypothetical protein
MRAVAVLGVVPDVELAGDELAGDEFGDAAGSEVSTVGVVDVVVVGRPEPAVVFAWVDVQLVSSARTSTAG